MTVINIIVANRSGERFQYQFRLLFLSKVKYWSRFEYKCLAKTKIFTFLKLQIQLEF